MAQYAGLDEIDGFTVGNDMPIAQEAHQLRVFSELFSQGLWN
jgi:hypothetical protein